jgi:hypothetical protein
MDHDSYILSKRTESLKTARAMLAGDVGLLEGVKRLDELLNQLAVDDQSAVRAIREIVSEIDHIPVGETRSLFAPELLQRLEQAAEIYLSESKTEIMDSCREIVRILS